jgi:hypothetical protein
MLWIQYQGEWVDRRLTPCQCEILRQVKARGVIASERQVTISGDGIPVIVGACKVTIRLAWDNPFFA